MADDTTDVTGRLGSIASAAAERARKDGARLVARAGDSYRQWSSNVAIEAIAPDEHVLPVVGLGDDEVLAVLREHDPLGSGTPEFSIAGLAIDPDAIVLAELIIAASITTQNEYGDSDRYDRMERYVWNRQLDIQSATGAKELFGAENVLRQLTEDWTEAQRMLLLVEAASSNPFTPYEIAWDPNQELHGLTYVATIIGLPAATASDVAQTFSDAAKAHSSISAARIGMVGLGAAAVLGGAGFLAAPAIGAAIGGAAGLSGAAATSSGLGLLGAMGGATVPGTLTAGGMWLVAQAGATAGLVAGAGGSLLYGLGAAQAQNEIIKLQVTYKMILIDLQRNDAVALEVLGLLEDRVYQLENAIDDEIAFSDPESSRLKEMRTTLESLKSADEWMDDQLEIEDDGSLSINVRSLDQRIARLEGLVNRGAEPPQRSDEEQSIRDLLSSTELARIDDRIDCRFIIRADLDRWDVAIAISAGIAAACVDALIVADPANGITKWLRDNGAVRDSAWLKQLEKNAKVPYDTSIGYGLHPKNHRVLTPGHDPLIGLVLGTRDILNATMTRTDIHGTLRFIERPTHESDTDLFGALVTQMTHLMSDLVTPAGLPLPGWTSLTTIPGMADTAVEMYRKGYDTWHLAPMALPVASIHATTSAYWALREENEAVSKDRKDAVTLVATGIAAMGDLAAVLATNGSPLGANYVTWLELSRRVAKAANRRSYRSALVTMDDATRNQHLLNHGWSALLV